MNRLVGLRTYLDEHYRDSIFSLAAAGSEAWTLYLHGGDVRTVRIVGDETYDITVASEGAEEETIPKLQIKYLHPPDFEPQVAKLVKLESMVRAQGLEPIPAPGSRYHIKNKSLFPLMQERTVVFFTLLEGDVLRGLVGGFSRYEITLSMKGGVPVTLLRHAVFNLSDKTGRCYLKSFQETHRDWQKSSLFQPLKPTAAMTAEG